MASSSIFGYETSVVLNTLTYSMLLVGGFTFIACLVIAAPYGRYSTSKGWGPLIPAKYAWIIMETPNLWVSYLVFNHFEGGFLKLSVSNKILLGMFLLHYVHRSLIYPFRMKPTVAPMPISVMFLAFSFCTWNGLVQSLSLVAVHHFPESHLSSLQFLSGICVFFLGMGINLHSDTVLLNLKKCVTEKNPSGYQIPRGGMFEYVSGANFFGEIIEWFGFSLACSFSLPSLAFALYSFSNIAPRAYQHHLWYLKQFPDYPKDRKAIIPFIW